MNVAQTLWDKKVPWAGVFLPAVILSFWNNRPFWRFFLSHPEQFGSHSLKEIAKGPLVDGVFLSVIFLALVFLGHGIRKIAGWEFQNQLQNTMFSWALGLGVAGHSLLLMGSLQALRRPELWILVLGSLAVWSFLKRRSVLPSVSWPKRASLGLVFLAGLIVWALWHGLIVASAPPTDWDTLAYHLAVPKLYVQNGGIRFLPTLLHSNWPSEMGMINTLCLLLRGDGLAQGALWLCWAVLILGVIGTAQEFFTPSVGLWAGALFATLPLTTRLLGTARSDVGWALFAFCGLTALNRWREEKADRWLVLAGLMAGLCASVKLLGAIPLAAIVALVFWVSWRKHQDPLKVVVRKTLLCGSIAMAVVGPWYLRTWIETGNPVWPFAYSIWGGVDWSEALSQKLFHSVTFLGTGLSLRHFVLLPLRLILWPEAFDYEPRLFVAAGLVVFFLGLIRRGTRTPEPLKIYLLFAALCYPALFYQQQFFRLFLPALPGLVLWLAWMSWDLLRSSRLLGVFACLLCGLCFLPSFGLTQNNEWFFAARARPSDPAFSAKEAYLGRTLDVYPACRYANDRLPQQAKVLLFEEVRGYYLERSYLWGDPVIQGRFHYDRGADFLYQELKREGVTHVLVNGSSPLYASLDWYYTPQVKAVMIELLKDKGRLLDTVSGVSLYVLS